MRKIEAILLEDIDLEILLDKLDYSSEAVEHAAQEQAKLFEAAARFRVQRMRAHHKVLAMLALKKATLDKTIRDKYIEAGESLTEAQLKNQIQRSKSFQELQELVDKAEEEEEYAKLLVDAYRMRRDSLEIIQTHRTGEWRALQTSTQTKMTKSDLRKKLDAKYRKEEE